MRLPWSQQAVFLCLLTLAGTSFAESDKTTTSTACTATSPAGSFFDLRPDIAVKAPADGSKASKNAPTVDYHARGYDYASNFTLNICGAVVEPIDNVRGVDKGAWQNISAYYVSKGDVYSLGSQSSVLTPRGRKLVLQYKGGSPCGPVSEKRDATLVEKSNVHTGASYKPYYGDEDENASATKSEDINTAEETSSHRRKSATISFLCNQDPIASGAAISFVGTDPDECAYFFEVRSPNACAGVEPHKPGSVGPGSVFVIIFIIAVLVYLGGGIFYQRAVANARGWRQLPNYSLWAGIWSFVSDVFVMTTSSCARFLPSRRGYRYISGSSSATRRSRDREAENRLIDQLDEEWDD
ncbi:mannose-6-phosphate receptor binding domain-containing protein [Pseudomassariella vexata]|uniref:Mannose-6-phosphate receptor binding domain-containing protein n=1 Tax=Pseudomassariella vexata TaxID=1141098 RepID=A0A1Y2DIR8_9PEZI|nr:mannose-6-phosphate receptor binding domain-containing protein [Pseudomassariella vexata]ORY59129.1 mannose-6-phosphate receptor binding domain-containing protein [Pseudomassariella vexata]